MDSYQDFGGQGDDVGIDAPLPVSGDERRMHVRAYNYWVSLLDGAPFPSIDGLDLEASNDLGPQSVLLDFTANPEAPVIAWLGERLRTECDLPADVATIADVPPRSLLSRLTDHHLQIIANRAPIGFEAEFVNARGNEAMYRGILLPFSSDGETIDFVYGVINWKEVAGPTAVAAIEAQVAATVAIAASPRPMVPIWADGPSAHVREALAGEAAHRDADTDGALSTDGIDLDDRAGPAGAGAALAAGADTNADVNIDANANADEVVNADAGVIDDDLGSRLAAARATANAAISADTRSRGALYHALAQAYDFALLAHARPHDYDVLLTDSGIRAQARAPMTPIAKLIFGADYDKTRLTEFAAALGFARRRGLPSGGMKLFLENFPGGLKAIVAAERRERRPLDAATKPNATREAARLLAEQAYLNLAGDDEFVVLVARRVDPFRVAVVGVVPDDVTLLDRALKQIIA